MPRDVDAAEFGVRARVAAAAQRGGFVLLVGGSSVGKTRCAVEAVKALLPDWWLVHPAGPAEVAALAQAPSPRTVVWLDELQRYLDGEHGLTGAVVRALLNAPHPVVIIGTLWPDRYTAYTAVPDPAAPIRTRGNAKCWTWPTSSASARSSARRSRTGPAPPRPVIRGCGSRWSAAGYGLTQTLAAAPQLVARWQDAQTASPYAWAVLTAALDAARLGARAPLSADFLRAAAPGYCTSQQQAEAPDNWFEQALAYATGKLHGAAAALSPAGAGMGQIAGYTVADYLIQHASRERRYARVPASTWDAVLSHIRDPADTARLADSARNRLLYRYAIPLYRHAADAGDGYAAWRLADLLAERGDLDGGQICAPGPTPATGTPPSGWPSCWPSAATWTGPSDLRARADAGDRDAAWQLAELLAERGDLDGLRRPGRRRRRARRLAAGRAAGRARRPGRAARPGRRRRRVAPPGGWPSCWPSAATWTGPADPACPGRRRRLGSPPSGWPSCWPSAATWTSCAPGPTPATRLPPAAGRAAGRARRPGRAARPGRRRRRGRRPAAGRAAGRARRPGRAARPGRRRRQARRLAAGRAAGRARRPGRGRTDPARPGRRRRRACRRAAGRAAGRARRPGRAARPGRRRRRGRRPAAGRAAGRARRPGRAARPGRRRRRVRRQAAGRAAGRARRPGRAARPGRRRRRVRRRAAGRAAGRARRPGRAARPGRRRRRVRRLAAGRAAGRARRPGRAARPGRRRRRGRRLAAGRAAGRARRPGRAARPGRRRRRGRRQAAGRPAD